MYQHLYWADEHILSMLKNLPQDHQEARKLFSHILFAEEIWLARLNNKDSSGIPLWVPLDLDRCEQLARQNGDEFARYFSHLSDNDLDTTITYKNSTNKEYITTIRDVLIHIALHGQYHRGQINKRIREAGLDPINVDFITFTR